MTTELIPMSEAVLTESEVNRLVAVFKRSSGEMMEAILDLFEGNAHTVDGYPSFTAFAKARLSLDLADGTIRNYLQSARGARNLRLAGCDVADRLPKKLLAKAATMEPDTIASMVDRIDGISSIDRVNVVENYKHALNAVSTPEIPETLNPQVSVVSSSSKEKVYNSETEGRVIYDLPRGTGKGIEPNYSGFPNSSEEKGPFEVDNEAPEPVDEGPKGYEFNEWIYTVAGLKNWLVGHAVPPGVNYGEALAVIIDLRDVINWIESHFE